MNKTLMKKLQKCNTPENFYKLVMWLSACAGEGLAIGECDASDLLFGDILSTLPNDDSVFDTLDKESEKFVTTYGGKDED